MKIILRYLIYSVAIVVLVVTCLSVFKYHPEVQFAFIMPGVFILAYSLIRDDIFKRNSEHVVRTNFRGR